MLLWLNGTDNSRWAPNENYARELMELFTLGAGRGYTETRRARAGARADRLPQRLDATTSASSTSATTRTAHDAGHEGDLRQARATSAGRTPCRLVPAAPGRTRRSSSRSSGATSSRRRPTRATQSALARALRQGRLPGAAGRRGDPACTRTSTPGRGWSSRRSSRPPGCCARSAAASTPTPGSWLARAGRASSSSTRRTSPAGTTRAGSTRRRSAPAGDRRDLRRRADGARPVEAADAPPTPPTLVATRARASGATRRSPPATRAAPRSSSRRRARDRRRSRGSASSRRRWSQNALRQLVAVSPDFQTA